MSVSVAYMTPKHEGRARVHYDSDGPIVDRRAQATFWWRLECTTVWVFRDIAGLVVDDGLDERRKLWVLCIEGMVLRKLFVSLVH